MTRVVNLAKYGHDFSTFYNADSHWVILHFVLG